MNRVLKILAIVVLIATIIGAGVVLYGLTMMKPQAADVSVTATPAVQVQDTFDALMADLSQGTFDGRAFASADGLRAEDCTFLTYTVRVRNRGFFPAEWISLAVLPQQSADGASFDVLQLGDTGAYVLGAGSEGDLQATILRMGDAGDTRRTLRVTSYVFGQRVELDVIGE